MHSVVSFAVHVCVYILAIKTSLSQLPYNQPMTVQGFSQQLIQLQGALIQLQGSAADHGKNIAQLGQALSAVKETTGVATTNLRSRQDTNEVRLDTLQQNLTEVSTLLRIQYEKLSEISSKVEQLQRAILGDDSERANLSAIVRKLQSDMRNLPSRASFVNTGFSNSWYRLVNEAKTWNEAERYCQELHPNGHLAMVTSAKENSFIEALLKNRVSGSRPMAYLGGHDIAAEGQWKWQNGQSMSYTNWAPNEPNNSGSREDCAEFVPATGKWNDIRCTQKQSFLCQVIYPE
ncbi:hepatic lectin-like [Lingula anatina]|uniref:Hepatic lectin-like n=1 Tax=Lingula anatina TaxID=7574 RepID=A0A1S3JUT8_LINAN|nr:hepatic lectin-like [Lingula anatina]|eukprot:XP_013413866.1 hepatic lectin-like [Lingula anatina]